MSTEAWKLEKNLCRCCHSEGEHKSLSCTDYYMGNEVAAYSDMLRICLNIELIPVNEALAATAYSICELCSVRLQDAYFFKQQVLKCEEQFQSLFARNFTKGSPVEPEVKQEPMDLPDSNDADFDASFDIVLQLKDKTKKEYKRKKRKENKNVAKKLKRRSKCEPDCGSYEEPHSERTNDTVDCLSNTTQAPKSKRTPSYRLLTSDYVQTGSSIQCSRCDRQFNSLSGLRFHVKSQHLDIFKYKCSECAKQFRTLAPYTKHKLESHDIDDRIKCNACSGVFNTRAQLVRHTNSFHMLGARIRCELCDYECFSMEALYKHKYKHKTVKEHHCKFCNKAFLRKTTLDLHERIHTGDRRKVCAQCGQAFVQKASLNYHMAKYHPEVKY